MRQSDVTNTIVDYLTKMGWKEVFSNLPGNDFASHGFVVPLKGKVVDVVLLKNNQLMLLESDSEVSLKKNYHNKLIDLKMYLARDEHLRKWIKELERRNKIDIGDIKEVILAIAYYRTDFRFNLIKPELVSKGLHLYKITKGRKVIREHLSIWKKITNFLKK